MKRSLCLIAVLMLAAPVFAGDLAPFKASTAMDQKTAANLSPGAYQGTLLHLVPRILDGPVERLIPVTIHLDSGPIITGEAKYDEKTDRYDIRTVYAFSSDGTGKVKENWVAGYVVDSTRALGFPAMNKGMWIKPSRIDPDPKVTVYIIKATGGTETQAPPTVGSHKGTLLHWLPAGSGSTTGPSPMTIRLEDGSLIFGDAVYDDSTNCHDIKLYSAVSFDETGTPQRATAKGYVRWYGAKPGPSCPDDRGVYAAVARFTDKPVSERDEVEVVFTPAEFRASGPETGGL